MLYRVVLLALCVGAEALQLGPKYVSRPHVARAGIVRAATDLDTLTEEAALALLDWFDSARLIVAYNGHAFDMRVLRRVYGTDDARWHAHLAKLVDPAEVVRRAITVVVPAASLRSGGSIPPISI